MELEPIQQCVLTDRSGMGGPSSKRVEVHFAGASDISGSDGSERHQLDGVDHDRPCTDAVTTARLRLWTTPETERDGDLSGQHAIAQLGAELHHRILSAPQTVPTP
jgi:hypothetical protein